MGDKVRELKRRLKKKEREKRRKNVIITELEVNKERGEKRWRRC